LRLSDREAFATTTRIACIRVVEFEATAHKAILKVYLDTIEIQKALGVTDNLDAVLLPYLIRLRRRRIIETQRIRETGTTSASPTNANTKAGIVGEILFRNNSSNF
jgi:hypothetical protein